MADNKTSSPPGWSSRNFVTSYTYWTNNTIEKQLGMERGEGDIELHIDWRGELNIFYKGVETSLLKSSRGKLRKDNIR